MGDVACTIILKFILLRLIFTNFAKIKYMLRFMGLNILIFSSTNAKVLVTVKNVQVMYKKLILNDYCIHSASYEPEKSKLSETEPIKILLREIYKKKKI